MSIEAGSKLQGKVTGITHFGAFVELPGGSTGLVHISEVADHYVKDINELLKVGDEVTVKVVNVEKDGKVGLSIRKAVDRPEGEARPARPARQDAPRNARPQQRSSGGYRGGGGGSKPRPTPSFEDKVSRFLKDSEERLTTIKRQTESKRGGRGAKRG
ncbi:RNA binding protein, contains ribosomal protein S1 domain [Bacillus sp. JCM 19046]|uniref:S1 RNA binding domain protein n=1 Tax=Shouchella xiaoxiensis TaxID=766895 RepID=A0ABS2T0J3_9BACI|nr:S1 domain-containing RNA-binding protein [Shouchella xiaoxiensis]MBM7841307.1 S1 RNA binding domain protein [Shouchella xiaoxiensis]GAF14263.1 RNA binding protein, contains ribosomal protein S1 domain [Bacillus sp. JCM 19045]GAF17677.1 RNA binding protein, contains ribosomal protein S1 domain [Bacillus sp. JCM 19046]